VKKGLFVPMHMLELLLVAGSIWFGVRSRTIPFLRGVIDFSFSVLSTTCLCQVPKESRDLHGGGVICDSYIPYFSSL
jgi:hypothetical protein